MGVMSPGPPGYRLHQQVPVGLCRLWDDDRRSHSRPGHQNDDFARRWRAWQRYNAISQWCSQPVKTLRLSSASEVLRWEAPGHTERSMLGRARAFIHSQSGTTAIEYALVGGLVSIAIIAGATLIGIGVNQLLLDARAPI